MVICFLPLVNKAIYLITHVYSVKISLHNLTTITTTNTRLTIFHSTGRSNDTFTRYNRSSFISFCVPLLYIVLLFSHVRVCVTVSLHFLYFFLFFLLSSRFLLLCRYTYTSLMFSLFLLSRLNLRRLTYTQQMLT